MNLQLDGGHLAHAMFGRRIGDMISNVTMRAPLLLAVFVWPCLMMWGGSRCRLGYVAFAIQAAILMPLPHAFWPAAGIACPYL